MTVIVPQEMLGDIAVAAEETATKVHLDGSLVFRNGKAIGQRYRAQQANGYVTLLGIPPGHHTLTVNESH